MPSIYGTIRGGLSAIAVCLIATCDNPGDLPLEPAEDAPQPRQLSPPDTVLTVGRQVDMVVLGDDGRPLDSRGFDWQSSDPSRLVPLSAGTFLGAAPGQVVASASNSVGEVASQIEVAPLVGLTAGWRSTCTVRMDGRFFCWGWPPTFLWDTPLEEVVRRSSAPERFVSVEISFETACGLEVSRQIYCWGGYRFRPPGNLGDPDVNVSSQPLLVPWPELFVDVVVAWSSACGLTEAGEAVCWGNGGALVGRGSTHTYPSPPGKVTGGHRFTSLAADGTTMCGLTGAGAAFCWGAQPKAWHPEERWRWIGVFENEVCGISVTGRALCDGFDLATAPTGDFERIASSGDGEYCGISLGELTCWDNEGDRTTHAPGTQFVEVRMDQTHGCALSAIGRIACWGSNEHEQLGWPARGWPTFWVSVP